MNKWHIQAASRVLKSGGVIAYPTEAVWGLGCDPLNADAVQRILELKVRPYQKGLILIASDLAQCLPWIAPLSAQQKQLLEDSWPGFKTWVVPANPAVPEWVRGKHSGLAIRVSSHPIVRALCRAFGGPIVSTSANPAGRPPAKSRVRVARYFAGQLDYVFPGATGGQPKPSPIFDLLTGRELR